MQASLIVLVLLLAVLLLVPLPGAVAFLRTSTRLSRFAPLRSGSTTISIESPPSDDISERVIVITDKAMSHLSFLKTKQQEGPAAALNLRMGVRAGGCSGMSYVMDFIKEGDITEDDHIEEYEGIKCVVDPKSLLFLFGLQLDYSDELIGGGFKFTNPNAGTSCGCGKSFGV